jgi:hypothetical protein
MQSLQPKIAPARVSHINAWELQVNQAVSMVWRLDFAPQPGR